MVPNRWASWMAVLALLAASSPLSGQLDGSLAHESRVVLSWEDGGVWVSGHLTELVSGAPVWRAIVRAGTGGTLTDSLGWFRLFLGPDLPPEIQVESLGYTRVSLRFSPGETERAFFFYDLRVEWCESVFAIGHEPGPHRVALFARDLETGLPVDGRGSVMVRRYGMPDSTVVSVEATDSGLTLPIEAGVHSVVLDLQGYETWSREVFVVPFDDCDERRIGNVEEDVWLLPSRAADG